MKTITEILADAQARWAEMNPYDEGDQRVAWLVVVEGLPIARAKQQAFMEKCKRESMDNSVDTDSWGGYAHGQNFEGGSW